MFRCGTTRGATYSCYGWIESFALSLESEPIDPLPIDPSPYIGALQELGSYLFPFEAMDCMFPFEVMDCLC